MNRSYAMRLAATIAAGALTVMISHTALAFTPAKTPLNLGGVIEPNVMYILDDSGSMEWAYMPDSLKNLNYTINRTNCTQESRSGDNYFYACPEAEKRYLFSHTFNTTYYNPDVTYIVPPGLTDVSYTAARIDGYNPSSATLNLSTSFRMIFHRDAFTNGRMDYYYVGSARQAFYRPRVANCTDGSSDTCYGARVTIPAAQQLNFARWFSFYRTRMLAAKAGTMRAFDTLSGDVRVGYGTINTSSSTVDNVSTTTIIRGVRRFENTGTNRSGFFDWIKLAQADGVTDLRKALDDAGQYYSRSDARGPWSSTPGSTGGTDYACRQSYTILTTDGYWNDDRGEASVATGEQDGANGSTITGPDGQSFRYTASAPFSDSHPDTLADVAMYYWKRDLLPDLPNRVPTSPENPAFWQHMVTFGVGLGVQGSINPETAFNAIGTGTSIIWPNPVGAGNSDPSKIDDLLHAAVNSRGNFFSANDPEEFADALSTSLANIASRVASNTSVVPNARRIDGESLVYEALYNSADWSGRLIARQPIETSTGLVFQQRWEAGSLIPTTGRKLFTHSGLAGNGRGQVLNWTNAGANFDSQAQFNYIIGTRTDEQPNGPYRARSTLLGDIVNASIIVANKQNFGFQGLLPANAGGSTYRDFVANKATQGTPTVFVGSNNGFVHAFNADTGVERFAYMPNGVLPNVKALASPAYTHDYFADGKMQLRDVYINGAWKTVLVGGLGAGGKSVFALDVTNPNAFGTANVLWEVKDAADLGFTFSEPAIGRLRNGDWVAIFGNGHGSTNNNSVLFMVNIATGAVTKITAGPNTGGLSSPAFVYDRDNNGHIFIRDIYAGDLSGNLWKFTEQNNGSFDVAFKSGNTPVPLYIAKSPTGVAQPITVQPEIGNHPDGEGQGSIIYFGTGSFYTAADKTDNTVQSIYGIWDRSKVSTSGVPFSGRTALESRSILFEGSVSDRLLRVFDEPVNGAVSWSATERGWVLDLVSPVSGAQGERVIFAPSILLNRLIISSAIPSSDPCIAGGGGWTMVLDLSTGGRLPDTILFDLNGDGNFDELDLINVGTEDDPIYLPPSAIGSEGAIPRNAFDQFGGNDKYFLCTGASLESCIPAANGRKILQGRQSWRQMIQ